MRITFAARLQSLQSVRESVIARVGAPPGLSLTGAIRPTAGTPLADDIYALIAASEIHADLCSESLTEPDRVPVFRSEAEGRISSAGASKSDTPAARVEQQTGAEARLRKAKEGELAVANERLRHVAICLKGIPACGETAIPARTLRRWVAAYRAAEINLGSGYLGLLPEPRRGNTTPKLPEESRTLMSEFNRGGLRDAEAEDRLRFLARAEIGVRPEGSRSAQLQDVPPRRPPPSGFGADIEAARATCCIPTGGSLLGTRVQNSTSWRPPF